MVDALEQAIVLGPVQPEGGEQGAALKDGPVEQTLGQRHEVEVGGGGPASGRLAEHRHVAGVAT